MEKLIYSPQLDVSGNPIRPKGMTNTDFDRITEDSLLRINGQKYSPLKQINRWCWELKRWRDSQEIYLHKHWINSRWMVGTRYARTFAGDHLKKQRELKRELPNER